MAADLEDDGFVDLATASYGENLLNVLKGDGNGGFSSVSYPLESTPRGLSLRAADVDSNGYLDLVLLLETEVGTS